MQIEFRGPISPVGSVRGVKIPRKKNRKTGQVRAIDRFRCEPRFLSGLGSFFCVPEGKMLYLDLNVRTF